MVVKRAPDAVESLLFICHFNNLQGFTPKSLQILAGLHSSGPFHLLDTPVNPAAGARCSDKLLLQVKVR
jgi:hypothetical protein